MIPECREFKSPHPHYNKPTTSYTDFALWLKRKHNIADITIVGKLKKLKAIQRQVNLWNMDAVRNYIQDSSFKNGYKNNLGYAYADWCKYHGFTYDHQRFPIERELPYIPLEKEIDQLIGAFKNSKYGTLLQLLKETAFRPIEGMNLIVKGDTKELSSVKSFLNGLKNKGLIVRFKPKPWDPRNDAQNRINGLSNQIPLFDPKTHRIDKYSNNVLFTIKDPNFKERKEQLTSLFESLGECTTAIYTHLKSKPNDKRTKLYVPFGKYMCEKDGVNKNNDNLEEYMN